MNSLRETIQKQAEELQALQSKLNTLSTQAEEVTVFSFNETVPRTFC